MRLSRKVVFQCVATAILGIAGSLTAFANQSAIVDCKQGGQVVVTSGLTSTTKVLQSFPSCTITVSIHGGGLATIFSDNSGTPLANPFTAQNSPYQGAGFFYAANSRYDITISGAGIASPITFSDILLNDPASLSGCSQLPALTGDVTSAGGTCATVLPNVASAGTGLKTTINAKGQATAVATAASTDLSDTALIARLNAAANFGVNPISGGAITGTTASFTTVSNNGETVAGEIAPDVTGRQLGDSSHRWDAFMRNLDISSGGSVTGNLTVSGNVTAASFTGGSTSTPNTFGNTTINSFTASTALTVNGTNGISANGAVLFGGTLGVTGLTTLAGGECVKFQNLKSIIFVSASCGYVTWASALADCPSTGCDLNGWAPDVPLALGAFDTGSNTKPVTVDLGPYAFTATQITARQGFKLRGAGTLSTNITSVGLNSQPLFVNPQVNNNAITIEISGMSLNALAGNTSQDGIFFDCSTLTNAGVELSRFDNLIFNGFNGVPVHFKATQDGVSGSIGCTQGNTFTNVTAIRPTGATGATQNALRIEGGAGQFEFWNSWFDGQSNDTGTNVFVGTSGTQGPYSIHFHGTTNQNGFGYTFDGGTSITTENDHCENLKGLYNLATTSQLLVGVNIKTPHINSNCGVNAGSGYVVNIGAGAVNVDGMLDTPLVYSTPDKLVNNAAGNSASFKTINARTFNSSTPTNVYATVGITGTLNAAATVDLKSWNTVQVNTSGTSMSTFKSNLMPGESVTLYATGGTIQFVLGGNISLGNNLSPFVVQSGDSATFTRVDAGTPSFVLTGYSRAATTNVDLTAQTANIGSTLLYAVPSSGAGTYRASAYIIVTSVGTTSTMPAVTIGFTDKDNSTVQSVPFTVTSASNTLTTVALAQFPISAKASTNINYSTTGYASTGSAMQYALHIKLEYLGP